MALGQPACLPKVETLPVIQGPFGRKSLFRMAPPQVQGGSRIIFNQKQVHLS